MESLSSLAVAGGFMAGLGVLLALMLAFANKKLYVFEDPRIGAVEDLLPHVQLRGVRVRPAAGPSPRSRGRRFKVVALRQCTVSSKAAAALGVADRAGRRRPAAIEKNAWPGWPAPAASTSPSHARRATRACPPAARRSPRCPAAARPAPGAAWAWATATNAPASFGAIHHGRPVRPAGGGRATNAWPATTACEVCPLGLFSAWSRSPAIASGWQLQEPGRGRRGARSRLRGGLHRLRSSCAADAPPETDAPWPSNLAAVDYDWNDHLASREPIERCPTGAIVWLETPDRRCAAAPPRKILRNVRPVPLLKNQHDSWKSSCPCRSSRKCSPSPCWRPVAPAKDVKAVKYPGVRDAVDGNTAVIHVRARGVSDAAGAYPDHARRPRWASTGRRMLPEPGT
jgi:electron transport complex protein RnfB